MPNANEPDQSPTPEGFGVPWEQPKPKPNVPQDDNDTVLMDNPFTSRNNAGDETVLAPPGQGSFRSEPTADPAGHNRAAQTPTASGQDQSYPGQQPVTSLQDQAYPNHDQAYPSQDALARPGADQQFAGMNQARDKRPGQAYPPTDSAYPAGAYPAQGSLHPEPGAAYPAAQVHSHGEAQAYPPAASANEPVADSSDTVLAPPPGQHAPADRSATVLAPPGAGNFTHPVPPQQGRPPVATGPVGDRFEPATAAKPKRKFPLWAAILAGLVALALIAGLLYFFMRPKPAPAPSPTPKPTPSVSLPPAPPAVLSKDAHDIKLPDKVDPWFPRTVPGDPAPQGARRSTFAMADETSPKRLIMNVYEGGTTTLDQRSQALTPDSIKDHDKYRCGRLADTKAPVCLASVGNGVMEAHGNISDIQDGTVEDAFNNWVKANS